MSVPNAWLRNMRWSLCTAKSSQLAQRCSQRDFILKSHESNVQRVKIKANRLFQDGWGIYLKLCKCNLDKNIDKFNLSTSLIELMTTFCYNDANMNQDIVETMSRWCHHDVEICQRCQHYVSMLSKCFKNDVNNLLYCQDNQDIDEWCQKDVSMMSKMMPTYGKSDASIGSQWCQHDPIRCRDGAKMMSPWYQNDVHLF